MLWIYYLAKPAFWILPWILQAIGYYRVLRKMGESGTRAIVPFVAEEKLTGILYNSKRTFWHPLLMTAAYLTAGFYLRLTKDTTAVIAGYILCLLGLFVYGTFIIRLYKRLCKSFHKGFLYWIGMVMLPFLFLILLSREKEQFYGAEEVKWKKIESRPLRWTYNVFRELFFAAEMIAIVFAVGFVTLRIYMPGPFVQLSLYESAEKVRGLTGDGNIITRQDTMGEDYASLDMIPASRDHYFPDHSSDKDVTVLIYVIGSNLEHSRGLASVNITQMKDATKQGSALKFVMEAGGSKRWFTSGIADQSLGRYVIEDGKVTQV